MPPGQQFLLEVLAQALLVPEHGEDAVTEDLLQGREVEVIRQGVKCAVRGLVSFQEAVDDLVPVPLPGAAALGEPV